MVMMMRTVNEIEDHHHDDHDHHHDNQHREFSSQRRVIVGPTSTNHLIYDVAAPTLHHPFHNTTTHSYNTAFKIPATREDQMGSETSMGFFPFTSTQWKELERQAMIYKYMMASLPIPIDLLLPNPNSNLISTNNNNNTTTNLSSSAPNLRYINGKADLEPGRCKRTDGKKWRCSRDVAPNQKYCERHMNRGRPRSRKHVEQQQQQQLEHLKQNNNNQNNTNTNTNTNNNNNKRPRQSTTTLPSNDTSQTHFLGGSSSSMPNYHNYPCVDNASPFESRSLEWMIKTEEQHVVPMAASDPRWLHQNPNDDEEEQPFLNLNSYASFNSTGHGGHPQDRDCALFLYHGDDVVSDPPARSFIDAWSQTTTKSAMDQETTRTLMNDNNSKACSVSPSPGNLSPSSLTLSMGNRVSSVTGETAYDETLRVCNPSCWVSPLAEVLRPSAASEPPSPFAGSSPAAAMVASSPSGVLQKSAMVSLSDSSNCSSPGHGSASMAKPEIALF